MGRRARLRLAYLRRAWRRSRRMLTLKARPSETIIASEDLPSRLHWRSRFRFGFIVTSEALYLPVPRDGLPIFEGLEQRRIPLADVSSVSLRRMTFVSGEFLLSVPVLLLWLATYLPHAIGQGFAWSDLWFGMVFGLTAVTAILGGTGRFTLKVFTSSSSLQFTPGPSDVVSGASKRRAASVQHAFLRGCLAAGLQTSGPEDTTPEPGSGKY